MTPPIVPRTHLGSTNHCWIVHSISRFYFNKPIVILESHLYFIKKLKIKKINKSNLNKSPDDIMNVKPPRYYNVLQFFYQWPSSRWPLCCVFQDSTLTSPTWSYYSHMNSICWWCYLASFCVWIFLFFHWFSSF